TGKLRNNIRTLVRPDFSIQKINRSTPVEVIHTVVEIHRPTVDRSRTFKLVPGHYLERNGDAIVRNVCFNPEPRPVQILDVDSIGSMSGIDVNAIVRVVAIGLAVFVNGMMT